MPETFKARTDSKTGQGKGNSLMTGNMERVAWTAIEGRHIKSKRGECGVLCGRKDKVGKTSPDVWTCREPRNRK